MLEPLHRVSRRILQAQRLGHSLILVGRKRIRQGPIGRDLASQRNRVIHRELRAGSDGEVRGMSGIADEDDVLVEPRLVTYAHERRPGPAARSSAQVRP